jgi:hypothetical protein
MKQKIDAVLLLTGVTLIVSACATKPEIGVFGNIHLPFFDLNNLQIADLIANFLKGAKLD